MASFVGPTSSTTFHCGRAPGARLSSRREGGAVRPSRRWPSVSSAAVTPFHRPSSTSAIHWPFRKDASTLGMGQMKAIVLIGKRKLSHLAKAALLYQGALFWKRLADAE